MIQTRNLVLAPLQGSVTPKILRFTIKVMGKRISVVVYPTLKGLLADRRRCDPNGWRNTIAFVSRGTRSGLRVCFVRRLTGSETVAHESVHLAFAITGDWKRKTIPSEEAIAIATGKCEAALVQAFWKHGVYKR